MDLFNDSHKFSKTDEGNFIHTRELGEKVGGLYPKASWSDVTIHRVNIDDSMYWHFRNDCIEEMFDSKEPVNTIIVGEKKVDPLIRSSVSGEEFEKGIGGKKTYYRERKIPNTKKKNYPVKPINVTQLMRKQGSEEKYDEVSGMMLFTTSERDPGESVDSAVVIDRDIFKNGYGLYDLKIGEEEGRRWRELIGINRGFHFINQKYGSPSNKISLWGFMPENYEDIKDEVWVAGWFSDYDYDIHE